MVNLIHRFLLVPKMFQSIDKKILFIELQSNQNLALFCKDRIKNLWKIKEL